MESRLILAGFESLVSPLAATAFGLGDIIACLPGSHLLNLVERDWLSRSKSSFGFRGERYVVVGLAH